MKKLLLGLITALLLIGSSTCPPTPTPTAEPTPEATTIPDIAFASTVYLPLIFNDKIPVQEWHTCRYEMYDSLGFSAGRVEVWLKVEYHPSGPVRLVKFYDNFQPPTYTWTYVKWYARPYSHDSIGRPPNEITLLEILPVDTNWNSTFVESISTWKATTHILFSKSVIYELNPVAFKKGHFRYPIDCIFIPTIVP